MRRWIVADATVDFELHRVFRVNEWDGVRDIYLGFFEFLDDLGSFRDVPRFVVEASRGRLLPFCLRLFAPLIMRI